MKLATNERALQKKLKEEEDLKNFNAELDLLEKLDGGGYSSMETRTKFKELEVSRRKIL